MIRWLRPSRSETSSSMGRQVKGGNGVPVLVFEDVGFAYGKLEVLRDVSLQVNHSEFVCLVGRSGCGKTTMLRLAAGLVSPGQGEVRLDGTRIIGPHERASMVFQADNLFVWRTALDNAAFGLEAKGLSKRKARAKAWDVLNVVGLDGVERKKPRQLSGGMRQRVNLARALATDPEVLLMDEPFSALDYQTREEMQAELDAICATRDVTALFVTHDVREAIFLGTEVKIMSAAAKGIVETVRIPWAKPRDPEIKHDVEFQRLVEKIERTIGGATEASGEVNGTVDG